MTGAERGYLLLCCDLGEPEAKPLTPAQMRRLRQRLRASPAPEQPDAALTESYLRALGIDAAQCSRIVRLLDREERLNEYLSLARQSDIFPLTCISPDYPKRLLQTLGEDAPAVLFCRGDVSVLRHRCAALVGSRQLSPANRDFARHVGRLAAQEGFVLVSGNAVGADRTAQEACLEAGGAVISFVPEELSALSPQPRQLFLCEDGYHFPFSAARALRRNRLIHAMGEKALVAQCRSGHGGTWMGVTENLRRGWSEVYVFCDGSEDAQALIGCGGTPVSADFPSLSALRPTQQRLF